MLVESPVGLLELKEDECGITSIHNLTIHPQDAQNAIQDEPFCLALKEELEAYFAGNLTEFTVPLSIHSGTPFQRSVWQALRTIPYGETKSYGAIAELIENPKAVRAIGQANRNNPFPIVIPCHRVIGKNGKLVGYSGSSEIGLTTKEWLLNFEKNNHLKDASI